MCRYAMRDYRTHWACLPCRWTARHPRPWLPDAPAPLCPLCRAAMVDLGRDFHAPRRADRRQWRKVELLAERGITFDSCGCRGPGWRPRTLADAKREVGMTRKRRRSTVSSPA